MGMMADDDNKNQPTSLGDSLLAPAGDTHASRAMAGPEPRSRRRGGRPKGTLNKKTIARNEAMARAQAAMEQPFEGDAYAFVTMLYKDGKLPLAMRFDAAKAALAYERPRLAQM